MTARKARQHRYRGVGEEKRRSRRVDAGFQNKKLTRLCELFVLYPMKIYCRGQPSKRSAEGKSATVRIVLLKRGVRERKDFPDAKGIHRVMGEPRAAHFAAQRRRARCMTRTRARESMSTPVSKRKNSHVSVSFFFCERCVKKAPREGK